MENAETIAAMTRAAVLAMGCTLFAPDAPSAAATAVLPPAGVDSGLFVKELKSRFGAIITNGQGEMKGQIFRIAHFGLLRLHGYDRADRGSTGAGGGEVATAAWGAVWGWGWWRRRRCLRASR